MKRQKKREGMSFAGTLLMCLLLAAVCAATVVLNDELASGIGMVFNLLLIGGIAAYALHGLVRAAVKMMGLGRHIAELEKVDAMDGKQFEVFCAGLLKNMGYTDIAYTGGSADQGVDLLASGNNLRYAVQCKRYEGHVGNKAVQEAFAGKVYYGCDMAVVITNSYFTPSAEELAGTTGVLLWDRDFLRSSRKYYP